MIHECRHLIHYARSSARIDKTGWLHKRGYLNPSYKRRFFVLKGNMLFYFKNEDYANHDPIGVILLEGYTIGLGQPNGDIYSLQVGAFVCLLCSLISHVLNHAPSCENRDFHENGFPRLMSMSPHSASSPDPLQRRRASAGAWVAE